MADVAALAVDSSAKRARIRQRLASAARVVVSPSVLASLAAFVGVGLAVAGIYTLAGLGWALLVGSVPFLLLSAVLMRGLLRVQ